MAARGLDLFLLIAATGNMGSVMLTKTHVSNGQSFLFYLILSMMESAHVMSFKQGTDEPLGTKRNQGCLHSLQDKNIDLAKL